MLFTIVMCVSGVVGLLVALLIVFKLLSAPSYERMKVPLTGDIIYVSDRSRSQELASFDRRESVGNKSEEAARSRSASPSAATTQENEQARDTKTTTGTTTIGITTDTPTVQETRIIDAGQQASPTQYRIVAGSTVVSISVSSDVPAGPTQEWHNQRDRPEAVWSSGGDTPQAQADGSAIRSTIARGEEQIVQTRDAGPALQIVPPQQQEPHPGMHEVAYPVSQAQGFRQTAYTPSSSSQPWLPTYGGGGGVVPTLSLKYPSQAAPQTTGPVASSVWSSYWPVIPPALAAVQQPQQQQDQQNSVAANHHQAQIPMVVSEASAQFEPLATGRPLPPPEQPTPEADVQHDGVQQSNAGPVTAVPNQRLQHQRSTLPATLTSASGQTQTSSKPPATSQVKEKPLTLAGVATSVIAARSWPQPAGQKVPVRGNGELVSTSTTIAPTHVATTVGLDHHQQQQQQQEKQQQQQQEKQQQQQQEKQQQQQQQQEKQQQQQQEEQQQQRQRKRMEPIDTQTLIAQNPESDPATKVEVEAGQGPSEGTAVVEKATAVSGTATSVASGGSALVLDPAPGTTTPATTSAFEAEVVKSRQSQPQPSPVGPATPSEQSQASPEASADPERKKQRQQQQHHHHHHHHHRNKDQQLQDPQGRPRSNVLAVKHKRPHSELVLSTRVEEYPALVETVERYQNALQERTELLPTTAQPALPIGSELPADPIPNAASKPEPRTPSPAQKATHPSQAPDLTKPVVDPTARSTEPVEELAETTTTMTTTTVTMKTPMSSDSQPADEKPQLSTVQARYDVPRSTAPSRGTVTTEVESSTERSLSPAAPLSNTKSAQLHEAAPPSSQLAAAPAAGPAAATTPLVVEAEIHSTMPADGHPSNADQPQPAPAVSTDTAHTSEHESYAAAVITNSNKEPRQQQHTHQQPQKKKKKNQQQKP